MNLHFLPEAGEYLMEHGFRRVESHSRRVVQYFKDNKQVCVFGDTVDFFESVEKSCGTHVDYQRYQQHVGISNLNFCSWVMLFHIAGIVSLKEFAEQAEAAGVNVCEDLLPMAGYSEMPINDMMINWHQ